MEDDEMQSIIDQLGLSSSANINSNLIINQTKSDQTQKLNKFVKDVKNRPDLECLVDELFLGTEYESPTAQSEDDDESIPDGVPDEDDDFDEDEGDADDNLSISSDLENNNSDSEDGKIDSDSDFDEKSYESLIRDKEDLYPLSYLRHETRGYPLCIDCATG
jgi:hypothetical protein